MKHINDKMSKIYMSYLFLWIDEKLCATVGGNDLIKILIATQMQEKILEIENESYNIYLSQRALITLSFHKILRGEK